MYGLVQESKKFYNRIAYYFKDDLNYGLSKLTQFIIKRENDKNNIFVVYVDDLMMVGDYKSI